MTGRPYRFEFSGRAVRDLDKLPEPVAAACVEFVAGPLAEDPHRLGKPLRTPWNGCWSARRGDYRVVYLIDAKAHTVIVVHVDHRGRIYRHR